MISFTGRDDLPGPARPGGFAPPAPPTASLAGALSPRSAPPGRACGALIIPLLLIVALTAGGCGKKGDPLAPLRLVPSAVTELSVRQVGNEVQLKFLLPTTNLNGPGRIDLDRIEIYAMTVAPGVTPPNRDLLSKSHMVGAIAVKPPP